MSRSFNRLVAQLRVFAATNCVVVAMVKVLLKRNGRKCGPCYRGMPPGVSGVAVWFAQAAEARLGSARL